MKRSRACEDLRALECSSAPVATTSHNNSSLTGQRGVKRSKRHVEMVDSEFSDVEELSDSFLASIRVVDTAAENSSMQQHLDTFDALEFVMGMSSNYDRLSVSTACFDECLPPIRRNSRDVMPVVECDTSSRSALQFKKKLQLGGAESSMMMVDSVDAPASDILCSRYQLETRCMDPLDKRQSLPFDMSSFIMLSINPNR